MLKSIFTVIVLSIALIANGQTVTSEEYQAYLEKPGAQLDAVGQTFAEFDQLAQANDIPALKTKLKELETKTKALSDFLNTIKPLQDEKWYLPAIKNIASVYKKAVETDLPRVIEYMEEQDASSAKLSYTVMSNDINDAFSLAQIAQFTLAGKLSYNETSEFYCQLVKTLEDHAAKHFTDLKGTLKEGTKNGYELKYLPEGVISGDLNDYPGDDIRGAFVLYQAASHEEVMNSFTRLSEILLSCNGNDHRKPKLSEDFFNHSSPQLSFNAKDETVTKHYYWVKVAENKDVATPIWEIRLIFASDY